MITRRSALMAAVATSALVAGPALAEDPIKIGNVMPYSGPASAYGTIGKTINAYIEMTNAKGGVNGRQIEFISYDDGYSPPKMVEQVRRLVEQDEVTALFQTLGTPTNTAIHKYVNAKRVPHRIGHRRHRRFGTALGSKIVGALAQAFERCALRDRCHGWRPFSILVARQGKWR